MRSGREEQSTFAADLNKLTDGLEQVQGWGHVCGLGGRRVLIVLVGTVMRLGGAAACSQPLTCSFGMQEEAA